VVWPSDDREVEFDFQASIRRLAEVDAYSVTAVPARHSPDVVGGTLVAVPAYNEASTIDSVIREASAYADDVLVVDDGSTDGTPGLAREAGALVVEHRANRGYGATLQTAFDEAAALDVEHLVIMDGDGQHDASDIPRLCEPLERDAVGVVIGNRLGESSDTVPLYRRFGIEVINLLTNVGLWNRGDGWIDDTQSGFRAYDRTAVESLAATGSISDDMDASLDILHHVQAEDFGVEEVETTVDYDVEDPNSQHPISHGLKLINNVLRTVESEHPILSLGVPGFVAVLAGCGFSYWTIVNYLDTATFPVGLAFASVAFVLVGLFASFTGIILHSLNRVRTDR